LYSNSRLSFEALSQAVQSVRSFSQLLPEISCACFHIRQFPAEVLHFSPLSLNTLEKINTILGVIKPDIEKYLKIFLTPQVWGGGAQLPKDPRLVAWRWGKAQNFTPGK
jgi:hypothetical protein